MENEGPHVILLIHSPDHHSLNTAQGPCAQVAHNAEWLIYFLRVSVEPGFSETLIPTTLAPPT